MSGYSTNYQSGGAGGEANRLQRYSQTIGSNIQKITQNVKSMQQLIHQLGTEQDSKQLQDQLYKLQQYTSVLAKDTTSELQSFRSIPPPAGEQGRGWRMQQDRLHRDFTQALNEFQNTQRQVEGKVNEALKKARAQSDSHYFDRSGPTLVDLSGVGGGGVGDGGGGGRSNGLAQHQQQQQQFAAQQQQEEELQAILERENQIRKLESDIGDVNQIFKDLATMVHEQGEVIDSIEANVESAQVNVSQANTQLGTARTYQNKARRKKVILFIILMIIIAVIIGLIIWSAQ